MQISPVLNVAQDWFSFTCLFFHLCELDLSQMRDIEPRICSIGELGCMLACGAQARGFCNTSCLRFRVLQL